MDNLSLSALVGTISAAISSLLTIYYTKGAEARRAKLVANAQIARDDRKQGMDEASRVFEESKKAYDLLIERFEEDQKVLRRELDEVKKQLVQEAKDKTKCLIEQEALKGDIKALQADVRRLQKHDEATEAQVRMNIASIRQLAPDLLPSGDSLPPSTPSLPEKKPLLPPTEQ